MSVNDKLNDRVRTKISPELSARIAAMRGGNQTNDVTQEQLISRTAKTEINELNNLRIDIAETHAHSTQVEETLPSMRM